MAGKIRQLPFCSMIVGQNLHTALVLLTTKDSYGRHAPPIIFWQHGSWTVSSDSSGSADDQSLPWHIIHFFSR